jgi:hypothetical protein
LFEVFHFLQFFTYILRFFGLLRVFAGVFGFKEYFFKSLLVFFRILAGFLGIFWVFISFLVGFSIFLNFLECFLYEKYLYFLVIKLKNMEKLREHYDSPIFLEFFYLVVIYNIFQYIAVICSILQYFAIFCGNFI